jgi:Winged helix DNA-binding domain
MTTLHEVALLRLVAQRIAGPAHPTPADAVRSLTAVQAQDYPGALTSVALRSASRRRSDVTAAVDSGALVRSWPMRGTLHFVAAEDLPWLLELLGPRIRLEGSSRWAQLALTERDAERAGELVEAALRGGHRLRRRALLAVMEQGGVPTTGQRGAHLLGYLARAGRICLGPTDGGEQMFVLVDEWIGKPRRLDRDEALGELALRYFRGHGPATVPDLVRWAGSTLRDVRTGLAVARPQLACLQVDGTEYFLDPETPERLAAAREEARGTFLLPGFDEFMLGYGDRAAVLDPAFAEYIVPGGNGMFRPTVVSDGRIVGTWRYTGNGPRRTVTATPFTTFPDDVAAAIPTVAATVGD